MFTFGDRVLKVSKSAKVLIKGHKKSRLCGLQFSTITVDDNKGDIRPQRGLLRLI